MFRIIFFTEKAITFSDYRALCILMFAIEPYINKSMFIPMEFNLLLITLYPFRAVQTVHRDETGAPRYTYICHDVSQCVFINKR